MSIEFLSRGAVLIAKERIRQVEEEGNDPNTDLQYPGGFLARGALSYLLAKNERSDIPDSWPWSGMHWKPKGRIRNLVRAGALIAAEIDRLIVTGEKLQYPDSDVTEAVNLGEGMTPEEFDLLAEFYIEQATDHLKPSKGGDLVKQIQAAKEALDRAEQWAKVAAAQHDPEEEDIPF